MALTFSNLGASSGSSAANPDIRDMADLAAYTNTSWTPPSQLVCCFVYTRQASGSNDYAASNPFVGNGLTWVRIDDVVWGTSNRNRLTLWAADARGGASAGANSITFAQTNMCCVAYFFAVDGVELAPPGGYGIGLYDSGGYGILGGVEAAFVQTVSNLGSGTSGSVVLAAAAHSGNRPISSFFHEVNEAVTHRTNWVEMDDVRGSAPALGGNSQYRSDTYETTSSATWTTSSDWGGIAAEVRVLGTGGANTGSVVMPLVVSVQTAGTRTGAPGAPAIAVTLYPTYSIEIALDDTPLEDYRAVFTDWSDRGRAFETNRGRSYEFARTETGTSRTLLNNRDSALNPENTASPHYPLLSTRQWRLQATWEGTTYPLFKGLTQGFPQNFPHYGFDAVVGLNAVDTFYALAIGKLTPGSTQLGAEALPGTAGVADVITVLSTAQPMPAVAPFTITIDQEDMTVTSVLTATTYLVIRGINDTVPVGHASGSNILTKTVNFEEAASGIRIRQVLQHFGIPDVLMEIDTGQTLISDSEDLAGTSPLEHIQLVAETEMGRFFVTKDGIQRFIERHQAFWDFQVNDPSGMLVDGDQYTQGTLGGSSYGSGSYTSGDYGFGAGDITYQIPYLLRGEIATTEENFYNRIRLTIPSGQVIDVWNLESINQHFERTYEKTLPYADANQASDAAQFLLNRLSSYELRVPRLELQPAVNPEVLWPLALGAEIGNHFDFSYQPKGGGDPINRAMILERIEHRASPQRHSMALELTPANENEYWILGRAGFSELDSTTRLAY